MSNPPSIDTGFVNGNIVQVQQRIIRRGRQAGLHHDARQTSLVSQCGRHYSIVRSSQDSTSSSIATSVPVLAFMAGPLYRMGRAFVSRQVITTFCPDSSRS